MTFAKGDLPQPGKHNVQTGPLTSGTITKGNIVRIVAGNTVALAAAVSTEDGAFVALETRVFAALSVTDVQIAGPGTYVVVEVEGAIQPGAYVKVDDASGTKVDEATAANFAAGLAIGRYIKHAGEDIATPAADGETDCIILLGAA